MPGRTNRDADFALKVGFALGAHEARLRALEETVRTHEVAARAPNKACSTLRAAAMIGALDLLNTVVRLILGG